MRIIILSYRISGNDGVSLECVHLGKILKSMGHKVTYVGGELDRPGILLPELHFQWPKVMEIHDKVTYGKGNYKEIEEDIFDIAGTIEGKLRRLFSGRKRVDLLIVANVFSLPMHFPLAIALKRIIEELNIPTISKHHDFWWERERYLKSNLFPFFERWFPPDLPNMRHLVINKAAQREFKKRRGLGSVVSYDSFDFSNKTLQNVGPFAKSFRKEFGIAKNDIVFLQSTRIIPRKRIELSIDLVKKLNDPRVILVIAGKSGDEGRMYEEEIRRKAEISGIRHIFIGDWVGSRRKIIDVSNGEKPVRRKIYTLWDCYKNADFVVYPPKIEGFGNNLIEAIYFKKPIIVTPYKVFKEDIAPLGFNYVKLTPSIPDSSLRAIRKLISDKSLVQKMVDNNFEIASKNFSYEATERKIKLLFDSLGVGVD